MERQTNYSLLERYSDGMKDCTSVKFLPCDSLINLNEKQTKNNFPCLSF